VGRGNQWRTKGCKKREDINEDVWFNEYNGKEMIRRRWDKENDEEIVKRERREEVVGGQLIRNTNKRKEKQEGKKR
jgi:hypothetical protein